MDAIEPMPLVVRENGRRVPTVLWTAPAPDAPLVLLGHGGGSHKTAPCQQALAVRLVAAGLTVLAIDGPVHGERSTGATQPPGGYQSELVARGVDTVVQELVADWVAAIGAARAALATAQPLGYLGLSMGTRFGLPLAAALGADLAAVVLGKFGLQQGPTLNPGLHDPTQLRRAADGVVSPTLWHVQWDDELFPRAGQLEMFDCLRAEDKQLVAFRGPHGTTSDQAVDA